MSFDARSRMISFRLTAEEYEKFREFCFDKGIRSVSEMARTAINLLLQQPAQVPHQSLETRMSELEGRFHMLSLELKRLAHGARANGSAEPARLADAAQAH